MPADAISRLIPNITLVVRTRMRHTRTETDVAARGINRKMKRVCASARVCTRLLTDVIKTGLSLNLIVYSLYQDRKTNNYYFNDRGCDQIHLIKDISDIIPLLNEQIMPIYSRYNKVSCIHKCISFFYNNTFMIMHSIDESSR